MIYRVPVFYSDGGKAAASPESMVSYARHAVGNRDRGKAATVHKSTSSYARHVVGNCDGAKPTAIKECFKY